VGAGPKLAGVNNQRARPAIGPAATMDCGARGARRAKRAHLVIGPVAMATAKPVSEANVAMDPGRSSRG
jgi:hypothetical protein